MEEIKTLSFFGENGLSSTSANHVANLAKEAVRKYRYALENINFCKESISVIGDKTATVVEEGTDYDTLKSIPGLIQKIASANSLIAFLREAIKEKERRFKEAKEYVDADRRKAFDAEKIELGVAALSSTKMPVREAYPTEEDVKLEWTIGEQEKYLSLEAEAAALGKAIHEDGPLSSARIDLMNKILKPNRVAANGRDTIIYQYSPRVRVEDVDIVYDSLQKRFRSVQAELNGMKKRIEDTILERKLAIDNAYNEAMREYNAKVTDYRRREDVFEREMDIKRKELMQQVNALKIVIPNRLKPMYDLLVENK